MAQTAHNAAQAPAPPNEELETEMSPWLVGTIAIVASVGAVAAIYMAFLGLFVGGEPWSDGP